MVVPSRTLEKMVEILVRADPSYARSAREKEQADEVYSGGLLRVGIYLYMLAKALTITFCRYLTQEIHLLPPTFLW